MQGFGGFSEWWVRLAKLGFAMVINMIVRSQLRNPGGLSLVSVVERCFAPHTLWRTQTVVAPASCAFITRKCSILDIEIMQVSNKNCEFSGQKGYVIASGYTPRADLGTRSHLMARGL